MSNISFKNLKEAEQFLLSYSAKSPLYWDNKRDLEYLNPVLALAGNPHKKLKAIHVAGSSGKTSTCYYLAHLLQSTGKSVGLTVSPHIDSITERIQINGASISEEIFCRFLSEFVSLLKPARQSLSFFELMVVFELWVFCELSVDYAVIETGVGGLLDATNVITRKDKVCVITDIGYDHMAVLGNTLQEIAAQKAGIAHSGNKVFVQDQSNKILDVVRSYSRSVGADLQIVVGPESKLKTGSEFLPEYQQRNWRIARVAAEYIAERDGLTIVKKISPLDVYIPARTEVIHGDLIIDGAHNAQKTRALVDTLKNKYPDKKFVCLVAYKNDKQFKESIDILSEIAQEFIVTLFTTMQDVPIQPHSPEVIAKYCGELGFKVQIQRNPIDAYRSLLGYSEMKLITGSFYMISEIHKAIKKLD